MPSGTIFAARIASLDGAPREDAILNEWKGGGSRPGILQLDAFVDVDMPGGVTIRVAPEYLSIGTDGDFLRTPTTPRTAQAIADAERCFLPTRKIVDAIWRAAAVKLAPQPFPPSAAMVTTRRYVEHNDAINSQLAKVCGGLSSGCLVAGHKKDIVNSPRLTAGHVAIYGWHQPNGVPIQPLSLTAHADTYVDYSHGVRLVDRRVLVGGVAVDALELLRDPARAALLSDEGPFGGGGVAVVPRGATPAGGVFASFPPGGSAGKAPRRGFAWLGLVGAVIGGGLVYAGRD